MSTPPIRYRSFLLRLWLADTDINPQWRASLEDTKTGQRRGFASLEQLYLFLEEHTHGEASQYAANPEIGGNDPALMP